MKRRAGRQPFPLAACHQRQQRHTASRVRARASLAICPWRARNEEKQRDWRTQSMASPAGQVRRLCVALAAR